MRGVSGTRYARAVVLLLASACNGGSGSDPGPGPLQAPADLRYPANPVVYGVGVESPANTPTCGGGAPTSYTVTPPLPRGLLLNSVTGAITGLPAVMSQERIYTIIASNAAGVASADLRITVHDAPPAGLAYASNPAIYAAGILIPENGPRGSGGAVVSYSVSPELPPGLFLVPNTGGIRGKAPLALGVGTYTVTATNSGGSATVQLEIRIVPPPPPTIVTQPQGQQVGPGETATFTASATGTGPLTYAWSKDGVAIPGATAPSYTTPPISLADAGARFTVSASDSFGGSVVSAEAPLVVAGFLPTAAMSTARSFHTATLLPSGKVLVAGGGTATAELYDPATELWSPTGALATARSSHTATLLPSGKVLVVGGGSAAAELYDPATGTWTDTAPMPHDRVDHTATLLVSGKVLVVGGWVPCAPGSVWGRCADDSAVVYDPATETWTTIAPPGPRAEHTATLLASGKVLVAGGTELVASSVQPTPATATLFDPVGSWSAIPLVARVAASAARLESGAVLIAGGIGPGDAGNTRSYAESFLFDEATGRSNTASLLFGRGYHTATALPGGEVLVVGGCAAEFCSDFTTRIPAEVYHPASGVWIRSGRLAQGRAGHTATLLPSGKVLVAGGQFITIHGHTADTTVLATAELWVASVGR